jgi:hypothetical protein
MMRLAIDGAHRSCRHVEEMSRVGGAVSDAAADPGTFFDQSDVQGPIAGAQKVHRHQRAAGAAADNDRLFAHAPRSSV